MGAVPGVYLDPPRCICGAVPPRCLAGGLELYKTLEARGAELETRIATLESQASSFTPCTRGLCVASRERVVTLEALVEVTLARWRRRWWSAEAALAKLMAVEDFSACVLAQKELKALQKELEAAKKELAAAKASEDFQLCVASHERVVTLEALVEVQAQHLANEEKSIAGMQASVTHAGSR